MEQQTQTKTKIGTINIAPTWTAAMQIYIACLENGTEKGKQAARQELMELAKRLDDHHAKH